MNMEIILGIHQLQGGMVNCQLIVSEDNIILIDTGLPGDSSKIINYVEKALKRSRQDVKTIVITHNHFDHIGGLSRVKKATGASVAIHPADADYIKGKGKHSGSSFMNFLVKLFQIVYRTKPVEPDILLNDGDSIGEYQIIHTPGHTKGSICLYNPEKKVMFVGDNLQYKEGKLQSPGERLIPEPEKYEESMKKLLNYDIEVILTGHTAPVTSGGNDLLTEFIADFKR